MSGKGAGRADSDASDDEQDAESSDHEVAAGSSSSGGRSTTRQRTDENEVVQAKTDSQSAKAAYDKANAKYETQRETVAGIEETINDVHLVAYLRDLVRAVASDDVGETKECNLQIKAAIKQTKALRTPVSQWKGAMEELARLEKALERASDHKKSADERLARLEGTSATAAPEVVAKVEDAGEVKRACKKLLPDGARVGRMDEEGENVGINLATFKLPRGFPALGTMEERLVTVRGSRKKRPSMLLTGLEEAALKAPDDLVTHLLELLEDGAISVFGVSGNGKTRLLFLALARHFGFYFSYAPVGDGDNRPDQGAADLRATINAIAEKTDEMRAGNVPMVNQGVWGLLATRAAVFLRLMELTDGEMTPYQWLLVQLFPEEMLGMDVFNKLRNKVMATSREVAQELIDECSLHFEKGQEKLLCFVDEAQGMVRACQGKFAPTEMPDPEEDPLRRNQRRPLLSPVAGAFFAAVDGSALHYPAFSGTGLSMSDVLLSLRSKAGAVGRQKSMTKLHVLKHDGVGAYLGTFADWDKLENDDVVTLVRGWLVGRPRFAATFFLYWVDEYRREDSEDQADLQYFNKYKKGAGVWNVHDDKLLHALDRFVTEMCRKLELTDKRLSGIMLAQTPYDLMGGIRGRAATAPGTVERTALLVDLVKMAVGKVALDLRLELPVLDRKLVECGVALLDGGTVVTLVEPLMIEAGVAYFGIDKIAKSVLGSAHGASAQGAAFEVFVASFLRAALDEDRLLAFMQMTDVKRAGTPIQRRKSRLPRKAKAKAKAEAKAKAKAEAEAEKVNAVPESFKKRWRLPCSAFGVLVQRCGKKSAKHKYKIVERWCDARRDATCAGLYAPILDPDNLAGPDHIVDLRNVDGWTETILALIQDKFVQSADLYGALRTTMPELVYFRNRDGEPTAIETCEAARTALQRECGLGGRTSRTTGVLRILILLPGKVQGGEMLVSASGGVDPSAYPTCSDKRSKEHADLLLVFDGNNMGLLFDQELVKHLLTLK